MIPKAELHVHLEGTAPPALVRRLAQRNGMSLPDEIFHANGDFAWRDFLHLLEIYDAASSVIHTAEDYRDVTYEYLMRCAAEGAVYVEVMSSPDHAAENGMSYVEHLEGIAAGIKDARAESGIEGRIVVTCVRHFGVDRAMDVARQVVANPHPFVVGFGMGGDEAAWPPHLFKDAFGYVAASGLPCTVHAGEWAGSDCVLEAVRTLPVTRIGHGVRAIEDQNVVAELADRGIVLEICPGSNLATGLYQSASSHPLLALKRAGVAVTLNSDDPPYFATTVGHEYDRAAEDFGLSDAELRQITRTAIMAGFVDKDTKHTILEQAGLNESS